MDEEGEGAQAPYIFGPIMVILRMVLTTVLQRCKKLRVGGENQPEVTLRATRAGEGTTSSSPASMKGKADNSARRHGRDSVANPTSFSQQ